VTVLSGGTDGLHYGLWYDNPAELPSLIAHNYARDSAETWTSHSMTLLRELRYHFDSAMEDIGGDEEEAQRVRPLAAALDWFEAHDRQALQADGKPRFAAARRQFTALSILPALPDGGGNPRLSESIERIRAFQSGALRPPGGSRRRKRSWRPGSPPWPWP
jgi:hypothetical protein